MGETLGPFGTSALRSSCGASTSLDRLREEQWLATHRIVASVESVEERIERVREAVDLQTRALRQCFAP